MDKIKIMDQVNVYRNIFSEEDLNIILNLIKDSEQSVDGLKHAHPNDSAFLDYHGDQPKDREDGSLIMTWAPWYTYGKRSIWKQPNKSKNIDLQSKSFNLIYDAILKVHNSYVKEYGDSGKWTYKISDWTIGDKDHDPIVLGSLEILKHKKNLEEKYTIDVHTDWHNHRKDEPGPKQILTYTFYINDDYDGGEVDFVDESNEHLIAYKPKRGDISVFPSGRPFWHGARAVTSENSKYFLRTFTLYRNPISLEWDTGLRIYGPVTWMEIVQEKAKLIIDDGEVGRQIVFNGDSPNKSKGTKPLFINKESYIDGRKIN